jgi:hypothetical protein
MSESDGTGGLDLSGVWQGQFAYPRIRGPVSFTATLTETNSWLDGTTEEVGSAGDARGHTITATLQGRRTGRSVTWLKLHDGRHRNYDAVQYTGEVNEDGTEIAGRWTVSGNWPGPFLMIRSGGNKAAQTREVTEKV